MNIIRKSWPHDTLQNAGSAWVGLEDYVNPIIEEFNIKPEKALEFGVDQGYSSYVLSKAFEKVTGVDSFVGDIHICKQQGDGFYESVKEQFLNTNVEIIRSSFEDFILTNKDRYDLIHIDIVHLYEPTYKCAEWSLDHSDVVILHDTMSHEAIYKVCVDLATAKGVNFYNIPEHYGLGILFR
tara:strand:+ start:5408 stop:5953 length:546 start_codon:yes stop_codon:yes gene_type:complete